MTLTWSKLFYALAAVVFVLAALTASLGPFLLFPLGFAFWMVGKAVT